MGNYVVKKQGQYTQDENPHLCNINIRKRNTNGTVDLFSHYNCVYIVAVAIHHLVGTPINHKALRGNIKHTAPTDETAWPKWGHTSVNAGYTSLFFPIQVSEHAAQAKDTNLSRLCVKFVSEQCHPTLRRRR